MIIKLTLTDFQSHSSSCLNFTPGVNILIGESNSGKTSIIRALMWCAFNKPNGDSFIRHGSEACSVELVTGEGETVKRIRGKRINEYTVGETTYSGFGQSVPEPVQNILNITDINVMRQLDAPFMLSMTSGEVAQYLNSLVDLDIITSSVSYANRKHKEAKQETDKYLIMFNAYTAQLEELEWIDEAEEALDKLVKLEEQVQFIKNEKERLLNVVTTLVDLAPKVNKLKSKVSLFEKDVLRLDKLLLTKRNTTSTRQIFLQVLYDLRVNEISKKDTTLISQLEKLLINIKPKQDKYNYLVSKIDNMIHCLDSVRLLADSLTSAKQSVLHCTNVYEKAKPETCPLCGAKSKGV